MTQRVADDFSAIRKRMEELTAQEELKHVVVPQASIDCSVTTDTADEHTIAVQPSTGKRYKWINGSWTEEEYSLPSLGPIDHKPSQTWQQNAQQYYDWLDEQQLTYEEWAKQGHTLLDYMI